VADDDLTGLAERPGWTVEDNQRAMYAPLEGGRYARVSRPVLHNRASERFQVALVSPAGVAKWTQFALMVGEARRVAEGWVRGKHPQTQ
jgi:hypothetical protein